MRKDIKASCQKRLSRIEGQVRGLSKMLEDDRYCIDIVTQISAVRAALRRLEEEVLKDHVAHCVEHAIASGDKVDQRQKISELMDDGGFHDLEIGRDVEIARHVERRIPDVQDFAAGLPGASAGDLGQDRI